MSGIALPKRKSLNFLEPTANSLEPDNRTMALDHYVSQVHLKQFLRLSDRNLLLATRKADLFEFTPKPKDVCRLEDGSTNEFLTQNRAGEDFLKDIEPAYDPCLEKIMNGELDWASRQVFGGFLAYIQTYTPAAIRMFDPMIRMVLENTIKRLEHAGEWAPFDCPEIPDWHGKSLSQLKAEGKVKLDINLKMPQAMATTQLYAIRDSLASSDMTILRPRGNNRFLTSDFPSIILSYYQNKYAQRFLPISPKLGIIFHTHTSAEEGVNAAHKYKEIGQQAVREINDEIIRAAENLVFSTHRFPWLRSRVRELKNYRAENVTEKVGPMFISQQRAIEVV
ncbi:DUF4238 domain-containing protein [Yoonia sp.]|uniref:DUF4238 domain-containing protein n=1 Tax=Yoonia sp. TaxID=2212373 RepID=UPI003F4AB2E9